MTSRVEATLVGEIGERSMVLLNVAGDLLAIDDECTHHGCNLSEGNLDGAELECIYHSSIFVVRTGDVLQGPAEEPMATYQVLVEGGKVYIQID